MNNIEFKPQAWTDNYTFRLEFKDVTVTVDKNSWHNHWNSIIIILFKLFEQLCP